MMSARPHCLQYHQSYPRALPVNVADLVRAPIVAQVIPTFERPAASTLVNVVEVLVKNTLNV